MIYVAGPTGIGKTSLSIELAKKLKTDIISCDSRQFYKELKIGTSPPTNKQLKEVKHYFIHNRSVIDDYSVCLLYTSPSPRDQRGSGMPACG